MKTVLMKLTGILIWSIFIVPGTFVPALHCEDATPLSAQIQALFNEAARGFRQKNAEAIAQIALPEATLEFKDGKVMTLDEWKTNAAKEFSAMLTLHSDFKVETAKAAGNSAEAEYAEQHVYVLIAEKDATYADLSRWRVSLVKTPAGWRAKNFEQLSASLKRNGIPVANRASL